MPRFTIEDLGWNDFFAKHFEPYAAEGWKPARLIRDNKISYGALLDDGAGGFDELEVILSGKVYHDAETDADLPAVGDWVALRLIEQGKATIHAVLPRRSKFARKTKGSKTEENLKEAFAGESQANRRYLWFAQKADVEGYPDASALFRSVAEGETGHAHGHLEFLAQVGDPATGEPIGETEANFKAAIAGETYEYTQMYPGFAKTAREEGLDEIADWFETLARAEKSHAGRFQQGLEAL